MITALAAAEPDEPTGFAWSVSPTSQAASGGLTTVYLDPTRAATIPLSQISVAAGYCRTLLFGIWPRRREA